MYKIPFYFMYGRNQLYIAYNTYPLMGTREAANIKGHDFLRPDAKHSVGTHAFAISTHEG